MTSLLTFKLAIGPMAKELNAKDCKSALGSSSTSRRPYDFNVVNLVIQGFVLSAGVLRGCSPIARHMKEAHVPLKTSLRP
jgi:hypothetical protein